MDTVREDWAMVSRIFQSLQGLSKITGDKGTINVNYFEWEDPFVLSF